MNPIDLAVIAVYVAGCTALGAWLGARSQGLKGYFLGESNIPAWAVMISIAATMLRHLTGWSLEAAIVAVAAITVVYTFLGGMKAVIWTDVIQFSVYILGALVALMILAGRLPGGWSELVQTARAAGKFRLLD